MRRCGATAITIGLGFLTVVAEAALNYDPRTYWPPYIVVGSAGLIWDAIGYFYVDRHPRTEINDSQITSVTAGIRTPEGLEMSVSVYSMRPAPNNFIDTRPPSPDPWPLFLVVFFVMALVVMVTWLVAQGLMF